MFVANAFQHVRMTLLLLLGSIHVARMHMEWTNSSADGSNYPQTQAMQMIQFSTAAYCGKDITSIKKWSCKPCKHADPGFEAKVFTDAKTSGLAYVGVTSNKTEIVVVFRGSANLANWISDLNFPRTSAYPKCNGCKVHGGFYKAWQGLQDDVVHEVVSLTSKMPKAKLYITGHSLGAALAVLAAADLHYTWSLNVDFVFTFGEPRVGNQAFRDFYSKGSHVSWRVTHWRDPVPKLPLSSMGFKHHGTEVFYNSDSSSYTQCDGTGHDMRCSDGLDISVLITDHTSYLGLSQMPPFHFC